ncbi:hypothetical protein Tco_0775143 [Tanacetum coccineum]
MEDGIFFNQSKYIKEMLKKFELEDSKPTKTPMSTDIKLTKDDEADSVDNSKYQVIKSCTPNVLSDLISSLKDLSGTIFGTIHYKVLTEERFTKAITVWICQILQENSQKRTRERMSDQEAKEIKAEAREIMPQPSTVNCS